MRFLLSLLFGLVFLAPPALAADAWVCPMHCEGAKTYPKPGKCPVCGMELEKAGQRPPAPLNTRDYRIDQLWEPKPPVAGQPTRMTLFPRRTRDGSTVTDLDGHFLVTLFTEDRILVRRLQPERRADGGWSSLVDFPGAGKYLLYAEFTPANGPHQIFPLSIMVEGQAGKPLGLVKKAIPGRAIAASFVGNGEDCLLISEDTTYFARLPVTTARGKSHCEAQAPRPGGYRLWYASKFGEQAIDFHQH